MFLPVQHFSSVNIFLRGIIPSTPCAPGEKFYHSAFPTHLPIIQKGSQKAQNG